MNVLGCPHSSVDCSLSYLGTEVDALGFTREEIKDLVFGLGFLIWMQGQPFATQAARRSECGGSRPFRPEQASRDMSLKHASPAVKACGSPGLQPRLLICSLRRMVLFPPSSPLSELAAGQAQMLVMPRSCSLLC